MKDAPESYFLKSDISPLIDGGMLNDDLYQKYRAGSDLEKDNCIVRAFEYTEDCLSCIVVTNPDDSEIIMLTFDSDLS